MQFKKWLSESSSDIVNFLFLSDGRVIVHINGKKYIYMTDTAYHEKWKSLSRFKPFIVLNEIKKHIRLGVAKQIFPVEVQPQISKDIPRKVQKHLF